MTSRTTTSCPALIPLAMQTSGAKADAGGVGFWLPGSFGSLAAARGVPGWIYAAVLRPRQAPLKTCHHLNRLANLSLGLVAFDTGADYTYFNPKAATSYPSSVG